MLPQRRSAFGIKPHLGLPARGGDGRLETEPPDDLFDVGINTMRCCQMRRYADASTSIKIVALDTTQRQSAADESLQQQYDGPQQQVDEHDESRRQRGIGQI